ASYIGKRLRQALLAIPRRRVVFPQSECEIQEHLAEAPDASFAADLDALERRLPEQNPVSLLDIAEFHSECFEGALELRSVEKHDSQTDSACAGAQRRADRIELA